MFAQPQYAASLGALYQNAAFCYLPSVGFNLIACEPPTRSGVAAAVFHRNVAERLATSGGSANYLSWATSTKFDLPASGYTAILVARRIAGSGANYDRIFHRDVKASVPSGAYGFLLTPAADGTPHRIYFVTKSGVTSVNIGYVAANPQTGTTEWRTYVVSHDGTTGRMFVDGIQVDSQACAVAPASSLVLRIGNHTTTPNAGAPVDVALAMLLPRPMSSGEAVNVSSNPWLVFKGHRRQIWANTVVSSLPTLSSSTYKPGTLTADGWQPRVTAS